MRGTSSIPDRTAFDPLVVARQKAERGLTTAVVIPARDEGSRVADVVGAIRRATVAAPGAPVPLVDELVVVDGASRDDTAARAAAAGARVVPQGTSDAADVGAPGKGAALRCGVAATSADLVAFVDADVHDPDPWLAVGTLAPLLLDERLRLVKSAAQRAWDGDRVGGGRVTELTVRPLLALLWPAVAHVAQPLAGEYAADRQLLEHLPFEAGYGVELGLLLDTARLCGPEVIGQVDLGVRGHDHQTLDALGRMAAELVLVVADRLAVEGRPVDVGDASEAARLLLPQPVRDADGTLTTVEVPVRRRPLGPLAAGAVSGGPPPARRGPSPRR